jgi:hypothetical protein
VRIAAGLTQTFYAGADEFPAAGVPVWFADPLPKEPSAKPIRDGNYVCCFDASGLLRRFEVDETATHESTGWADALFPFRGSPLVPVPKDEDKLVFVKSHATGKPGAPDESEVLLGDLATGRSRVIVPRSKSTWRFLSISPDGTRIAMVSDRDHESEQPRQWRVFVAGMEGGEPQPLTSADVDAGPVGWTSDGSGLVYARSQHPLPAENWENENLDSHTAVDLYFWDFGANRETRLSRGGGFFSPSVTESDELYYLTVVQGTSGPTTVLRHMTLVAAREFASNESETAARDQKAWQALLDEVLTKPYQGDLTSAFTAQITDRFAKSYRERFKAEPPADLQQLHRLRLELAGFRWATKSQADVARLLGVLEGECLVRQHGGRWNLAKGLRTDGPAVANEGEHRNPFAMALNPFAGAGAWLRDEKNALDLSTILHRAGGRSLVLGGDLSTAQPALDSLADPDFASAEQLLRTGAAEPAEALLLKMLGKSQHAGNHVLVVQTANLLHEHGRSKAFRQVMEKECEAPLLDPWRYNLLGLARLQDDPRGAIDAFKYSLRCDLRFEAGYLNLALAYERAGQPAKAHACLRHYQALMPAGKYAADAARRLTAWGEAPSN